MVKKALIPLFEVWSFSLRLWLSWGTGVWAAELAVMAMASSEDCIWLFESWAGNSELAILAGWMFPVELLVAFVW